MRKIILLVVLAVVISNAMAENFISGSRITQVHKEYSKLELDTLITKAKNGDSDAQFTLGESYLDGTGLPKDMDKAFDWLLKSAKQGNQFAQSSVAFMYYNGYGISKDNAKVFEWSLKSAAQGNAQGQLDTGVLYGRGIGVEVDVIRAYAWLTLSEAQGMFVAPMFLSTYNKQLPPRVIAEGKSLAANWKKGDMLNQAIASGNEFWIVLECNGFRESSGTHFQAKKERVTELIDINFEDKIIIPEDTAGVLQVFGTAKIDVDDTKAKLFAIGNSSTVENMQLIYGLWELNRMTGQLTYNYVLNFTSSSDVNDVSLNTYRGVLDCKKAAKKF